MTRRAIPPPAICPLCGGDHGLAAHHVPAAAAHVWAQVVLEQARVESRMHSLGLPLDARAAAWLATERRAALWAGQAKLLIARGAQ